MKKFARTTMRPIIRGSHPKTERLSIRAGHYLNLLKIFGGWLFSFGKHATIKLDSLKGGARPIGRENQNKY
jgi:hypothetical protein